MIQVLTKYRTFGAPLMLLSCLVLVLCSTPVDAQRSEATVAGHLDL